MPALEPNAALDGAREQMKITAVKHYLTMYVRSNACYVQIETDAGITGHGEVCPLGPFYLPSYAAGARAGIAELAPHLLGEDPTEPSHTDPETRHD